jgi:hypothetical protein
MPKVHRETDPRSCGATTVVNINTTVFANFLLVAVNTNPNTHGGGPLIAGSRSVFAHGILTVNNSPDGAGADALCVPIGGSHCAPVTAGGSPDVFTGD